MAHLFGPVNSRRLGLSLGVDIIPFKTCTFDCIYCEVGPTTHLTLERRPYAVDAIIQEVEEYFRKAHITPHFITLAGSGEPTLNVGIGKIIAAIKKISDVPVAVLTNGALLYQAEVRQALAAADVVLPSLDAAREETFRRINRPAPGLTLEMILAGLKAFRKEYGGQLWLEILNDCDWLVPQKTPEDCVHSCWTMAARVLFFHPNKQQTREMTDRFYAYCGVIAQKTPAHLNAEGIDVSKETMKIIKNNVLLLVLAPALSRACEIGHRTRTNVDATLTILALLRYKADKDSFPSNLQELITAGYLKQLPVDLYNVKPLVYKKTADSFILYSIGPNFEDEGGKQGTDSKGRPKLWAENADIVFWPIPKQQPKQ